MSQYPNNPNKLFKTISWNFGHWDFGYYLMIGAWKLVIIELSKYAVTSPIQAGLLDMI